MNFPITDLLSFSEIKANDSEYFNIKFSNEFIIIWTESEIKLKIDNKEIQLPKDSILFVNDISTIEINKKPNIKYLTFKKDFLFKYKTSINTEYFTKLFYNTNANTIIHLSPNSKKDDHFRQTWQIIGYLSKNESKCCPSIVLNLLEYILIFGVYKVKMIMPNNLQLEYEVLILRKYHILVEENYKDIATVKNYAELLNVSPKTLYNIFKKYNLGTPFKKIKNRRVLQIKILLENTEKSIKEIAEELNFSDIHSLSSFFKSETGLAPSLFRKNILKKGNKF
ncbi:helix-turn-helix domain-containing protein [Flavobacterium oreochromis]|nr:response regulator transcription factor [Flavobacterium oreochromis]